MKQSEKTLAGLEICVEQKERIECLQTALMAAARQIEYLHEKFQETGSGNGVLAQIQELLEPQK